MKNGKNKLCIDHDAEDYCSKQNYMNALFDKLDKLKRESKIKQCFHPNKNECSSNIIRAHAIQNNRILSKLAVNGCVITMDGSVNLIFQNTQSKGRKIATTFSGFCSFHDKTLFQDIEDTDFIGTQKQLFLLTYRTLAWHYHKKQEQINATVILKEKMQQMGYKVSADQDYIDLMKGFQYAEQDNEMEKQLFDKYLIDNEFSKISYQILEIPYKIEFAISMMHGLSNDINGNKINDYLSDKPIKNIYLNIFPGEYKSYCIWSWLRSNDDVYKKFSDQFIMLPIEKRKNYLNNQMPIWSDSIVISPRIWNKWGDNVQKALMLHANSDMLNEMIGEEFRGPYQYMDTPWDFFKK